MISHGKHAINYVLSVSNGRSAGPVAAGNTIVISNVIPEGVTDLIAYAKSSAWKVKLTSKIGPSILTATYVGAYPVLAGASLAPLLVHGVLEHSQTHHLFLPAVVRLLHSDNPEKSSPKLLQQRPVQDFSVKGIAPQEVTPEGVTPLTNPTYQAGQTVVYTVAISNGNAVGSLITGDTITVTDSIPTGLTGLTASANSSDWTVSLGATTSPTTLTATYIGTYPVLPGASFPPIILIGTLTSPAVPQVVNSAIVVTPNDSNAANNTGTNTINVIASPDLTVTDPVPTGIYQVGKAITYTVTGSSLSSAGPVLAGDAITITDTIPTGLAGITASASSPNWSLNLSTTSGPATLTATYIGTYPVTAGTTLPAITISGTLTSTAVSSLLNTATISTPKDSNAANNTASNTITVVIQPDLTVTKTAPTGITYQVGGPITYTITASNASGAGSVFAGDAITVTDSIPKGLTSLTASGMNWTVSLGATTSPTTLTATYTGTYPVVAGANLPAISLTGTLTTVGLDLTTSPVGYWSFDENSGTVAYDSSSNHNTGTLTGGPTWTTGAINSALSFNGSNYVTMGNAPALQFGTGSFTAMTWFKTTSPSGFSRIINQGVGNWNGGFSIDMNTYCTGCLLMAIGGSGTGATSIQAETNTTYNDGNWHQAAMVIDRTANTAQLYVDGVAQTTTIRGGTCGTASGTTVNIASCTSLTASTTDPFVVGAYTGANGTFQYFNGSIDEVRAYNIALSSAQIQTLYATPPLTNTAIVTTPNDSNTANNGGSNTTSVVAAPDLTVTDPAPTGTYQVGKAITYTVTGSSLSSAGPVLAGDAITIIDTIPTGLTSITTSASNGWTLSLSPVSGTSPATLTATYTGTYPVTAGTTLPAITITGTLTSTAVSSLANTATISTPKDSNAANNTASNTITVVIQPDLIMTKTVPFGTTFQVGKSVTYTLTISDAGGAGPVLTGDPITIVDTIPAGLTALTASGTNWTVSLSTTTSPSTLTATYTGTYPVAAGTSLSAISLTGKFTIASLSPRPITAGYWPFDANAGTTAYDSSPNHNNGTITGASWATGKVNSGLSFNGTSNYVSMGTHTALQFGTGSFTTMSWFKTASTSGVVRIISQGLGSLNGGFNISMNTTCAGCVSISLGGSGTTATTLLAGTGTAFSDGNWHQAAMIINRTANTAQLYIDGVAQSLTVSSGYCGTAAGTTVNIASCSSLTANTADPFVVGAYIGASGNSQYFNGSIDEVRAYNSALSSAQIQTLYTIDTPPTPTGYWPFDANTGTVAYDLSSNHNNGTLTGGPAWTTGAINSGLSFNGTSNYVTMGNLPVLQFGTGSFTAMTWFKTTSTSGLARIFNQGIGSNNGGFGIDMNVPCAGCVAMELGGNGSASTVMLAGTGISFADGNWHQAAMVINRTANTAQLYIDGVAQSLTSSYCGTASGTTINIASCSNLTASTTDPFVVGAYSGTGGTYQYFNGSVDEVRVYGSALSSAQVYNLYTMPYTNTAAVTTPNDSNFTNNGAINKIQVILQPDLSATKNVALSPTSLVREQSQPFRSALKAISRRQS